MIGFWPYAFLAFILFQRIIELGWSERNRRYLMLRRGRECGAGHYPLMLLLHAAWLIAMIVLVEPGLPIPWIAIACYAGLQVLRVWTIASLGRFWTTRIITIDDMPLLKRGPYRLMRHPNYLIVAIEFPLVPWIVGLPVLAIVFGALNLAMLAWRIHVENAILADRRTINSQSHAMEWR